MKHNPILATALAAALFLVPSCGNAPEEKHTSYETITLSLQDLEVPSRFSATIAGRNDVSIIPQIGGQLTAVCVSPGQKVKKGDRLFTIDSRKANQVLVAAKADLLAAQAQCNSAELEYKSNRNLFEKQIVSEYMLNTSLNDLNSAKAAVAQAEAALANAKVNLEFCTVISPVSGLVGDIPHNPGDMVSEITVLTTISGNSEMKATFSVPELLVKEAAEEIGTGDILSQLPEVTLFFKDGTEYPHKGKVAQISGVVDKVTGSVRCDVFFPNPDGVLRSGIQGVVQMLFPYDDIIVAPLSALVRVQDKAYVYRVKDNCAESVIVEFAELRNGKDVALLSGVEAGDVIVSNGANTVYEGQQVIFPEAATK